ncbi:MAG TPA: NAD(P)/FAD-dependent oxidoreductase [Pyrinomonadaceae bacterium]|nr:NAD(P)/FAD-dependent oxidoreductase [Pyrinomonadaceae bacterium]
MHDVIIIGGGHNGLVAACYLAKAGLKTLVLERRAIVGGTVVTEEFHPGFRCSTVMQTGGGLLPQVMEDLQLQRHGLEILQPAARVTALNEGEQSLTIYNDAARTAKELESISASDAKNYVAFARSLGNIGRVLSPLLTMTPPTIEKPSAGELWNLGKLGLSFRGLDKKDAYRLLRWGPMAVADLVAEWFETELLQATVAARGIFGAFAGPWSAGTSTGILWQAATDGHATAPSMFVKGGLGNLTQALAKLAEQAGVEIKTSAEVEKISIDNGKATAVVLRNGEEIPARAIVSNADPRRTFLNLVDPVDLNPNFLLKIQNYRAVGTVAKLNLALSGLPSFTALKNDSNAREKLSGRIHIGPNIDYIERAFDAAKYGEFSSQPYLDVTIPTLMDPSLAPDGSHVMSIHAQFAPMKLKSGDWNSRRQEFGATVVKTLAEHAPDLKQMIVAEQVITPLDLEQVYGLSGGHIFHGEQSLDQFFTFRPLIGWSQYRTPIKGLYLCGSGTHPGGGVTGGPGANASREIAKDLKSRKR